MAQVLALGAISGYVGVSYMTLLKWAREDEKFPAPVLVIPCNLTRRYYDKAAVSAYVKARAKRKVTRNRRQVVAHV